MYLLRWIRRLWRGKSPDQVRDEYDQLLVLRSLKR